MMSKTKQIVAEIIGDGKLFDEGRHEEHMRHHGSQLSEERPEAPREARKDYPTRQGAASAEKAKTPT
jgi:hypothetical protein